MLNDLREVGVRRKERVAFGGVVHGREIEAVGIGKRVGIELRAADDEYFFRARRGRSPGKRVVERMHDRRSGGGEVVLARGNHEDCSRAEPGWVRLQGPSAFDGACIVHQPLYTLDLGDLRLAVLDDAVSGETDLDRDMAKTYAAEIASLADTPAPVWFIHHRPTWAAISGPLGIPVGGNLTLIEAARINAAKGGPMIPPTVALQLSGHIHTFESINYNGGGVPPQIVAGNGGDNLDVTPTNLRGAQFLGHSGVTVADGLSVGGFGFLLMTKAAPGEKSGWTIDLYDSAGTKTRTCRFTDGKPGRLDCPA